MAASVQNRVSYQQDLHAWTLEQAALLRAHRTAGLDWENLAEEILSSARRDQRKLQSHVCGILLGLLKWQAQPARRGASWRKSLRTQRRHIRDLLRQSPSLRRLVPELMLEAYPDAVEDAVDETGLPVDRFPVCLR